MIKIKDLKKGDVLQNGDYFKKVISVINEDMIVLSFTWSNISSKEYTAKMSQETSGIYGQYELKNYTLVKKDLSWRDLKEEDEYWYLDSTGNIFCGRPFNDGEIFLFRAKSNNIYQTKKDAEEAYKVIMSKE